MDAARRRFEAALEICRKLAIPEDTAATLLPFGRLLADSGDLAGARERLEEARDIDRGLGDAEGEAEVSKVSTPREARGRRSRGACLGRAGGDHDKARAGGKHP